MNADGTGVRQVSDAIEGSDFSPSWSPDGSRLIFAGIHSENWGIWRVNEDGSGEHRVLGGVGAWFLIDAEWSPDGSLIAFVGNSTTGDYGPDDALFLMRADGTGVTRVADAPGTGIAGDIAWQPMPASAEEVEPRLFRRAAEVVDTFEVGVDVRSVVYGEGSVWVAASNNDGSFGGRIVRIDPVTHEVQATIPRRGRSRIGRSVVARWSWRVAASGSRVASKRRGTSTTRVAARKLPWSGSTRRRTRSWRHSLWEGRSVRT